MLSLEAGPRCDLLCRGLILGVVFCLSLLGENALGCRGWLVFLDEVRNILVLWGVVGSHLLLRRWRFLPRRRRLLIFAGRFLPWRRRFLVVVGRLLSVRRRLLPWRLLRDSGTLSSSGRRLLGGMGCVLEGRSSCKDIVIHGELMRGNKSSDGCQEFFAARHGSKVCAGSRVSLGTVLACLGPTFIYHMRGPILSGAQALWARGDSGSHTSPRQWPRTARSCMQRGS